MWIPGRPLKACVPPGTVLNYAVASHVMEHVPNPIGWLNELLSVIEINGHLVLFLPDRRINADFFRQETGFYHLAQWWIEQPIVPTPGQILDFMSNSFSYQHGDCLTFDEHGNPLKTERAYTDQNAISTGIFSYNEAAYVDIHCSVWNADTFEAIFQRVAASGIINVEVTGLYKEEAEFVAILTKRGEPQLEPPLRKLQMTQHLFNQTSALSNRIQSDLEQGLTSILQTIAAQNALLPSDQTGLASRRDVDTLNTDLAHARQAFVEAVKVQNSLQADLEHARKAFAEAIEVQDRLKAQIIPPSTSLA